MTTGIMTSGKVDAYAAHPEKKVTLYFIVTGFLALMLGVLIGPLQSTNYGGIDLYKYLPFLKSYYQGLSLHGVLNALVFTTYFISGMMFYLPARALGVRPNMTGAWIAYWVMTIGLVLAAIDLLSDNATVLYTFYAPLKAGALFYIGSALLVAASLVVGLLVVFTWVGWKKQNPNTITPLVAYMSVVTWLMWFVASLGLVVEVLVFLIPWSLNLTEGVDPLLMRTLFWYTGHPIVYFWLLPAYVSWYGLVPKQAGGKLVSEPLARLAFILFLVVSTPVGLHHQYTDPGVSNTWKLIHMALTFFVAVPSLLTAFTVAASLEYAARLKGGKGWTGWMQKLPWHDPVFTAQALAMVSFIFGGAGGIVNASMSLDYIVHNTAWIPGHFHITVGTATTMTFFGVAYWLIPHLTGKPWANKAFANYANWLWFIGMMIFAVGMHWEGLLGIPRRAHISNMSPQWEGIYAHATTPMALTVISGIVLFISSIFFFVALYQTLLGSKRDTANAPEIPYAEMLSSASPKDRMSVLFERLGLWFVLALVLALLAYLPVLIPMLQNPNLVPGVRLW